MRGVHCMFGSNGLRRQGSSPHARGPPFFGYRNKTRKRIIPACAGSTAVQGILNKNPQDHPRMRGVHIVIDSHWIPSVGSSPHARGPLCMGDTITAYLRIIPACAGSTRATPGNVRNPGDHPRMRGVHIIGYVVAYVTGGSSPHARGPPTKQEAGVPYQRIIPACAGSTHPFTMLLFVNRDHPRMRGVHRKSFV